MKIEYEYSISLPSKIVWKYIKDAAILKKSLTGCKKFEETTNGIYQASADINFGPIQDVFAMEIRRVKEKSPSYYHLILKGKGKLGGIDGEVDLFIKEIQGTSKLKLQAEADLNGSLAIVGNKLLEGSAKKGLKDFFQCVEKEIKRDLYLQKRGR